MGLYSRYVFPHLLEWSLSARPVIDIRIEALEPASGRVLEIGFGTGLNLPCYPSTVNELVAVDSESMMVRRVQERIRRSDFPVRQELVDASTRLPFQDRSFDTVVTTFTMCSIGIPEAALREVRRALNPGGRYLFLEHGRSDNPRIARLQDFLNPMQKKLAAGCNLNRRIDELITVAGFETACLRRFTMPGAPRVFGEMYSGIARPARSGNLEG